MAGASAFFKRFVHGPLARANNAVCAHRFFLRWRGTDQEHAEILAGHGAREGRVEDLGLKGAQSWKEAGRAEITLLKGRRALQFLRRIVAGMQERQTHNEDAQIPAGSS